MKEGDEFSSMRELERAIEKFESDNYTNLFKLHSRTILAGRNKGIKRYLNPELEYLEIDYACIKAGTYKSQSKGIRPQQSSFRDGCPVRIKIRVSQDGTKLIVKDLITDHNHVTSPAIYNHLPRQRRHEVETRIEELMQTNSKTKPMPTKTKTKQTIKSKSKSGIEMCEEKPLTIVDVYNIHANSKLEYIELLERYRRIQSIVLKFIQDDEENLQAIFYQDREMQMIFAYYPELLSVDVIYKDEEKNLSLYVFWIEDGNGIYEIVAFCLLTTKEAEDLVNVPKLFKKYNPYWTKVKTVMTDLPQEALFKQEFQNTNFLFCKLHCLRCLSIQGIIQKMKIEEKWKDVCLHIFQKMVHCHSEAEYTECHKELTETGVKSVVQYFNTNWHPIRNQWVNCFQEKGQEKNRMVLVKEELFELLSNFTVLELFFESLDNILLTLSKERNKSTEQIQNSPTSKISERYKKLLTPYSFNFVSNQVELFDKIPNITMNADSTGTIKSSFGDIQVSATTCQCLFVSVFLLPCRHIFKFRKMQNLILYYETLCAGRWKIDYYKQYCQNDSLDRLKQQEYNCTVSRILTPEETNSNYEGRLKIAKVLTDELAFLLAQSSGDRFDERRDQLLQLGRRWIKENSSIKVGEDSELVEDLEAEEVDESGGATVEIDTSDEHFEAEQSQLNSSGTARLYYDDHNVGLEEVVDDDERSDEGEEVPASTKRPSRTTQRLNRATKKKKVSSM